MSIWEWLFNPSGLSAHGFCLVWAPGLITMHAASDAVIGLAYFSIPLALASFTAKRKDLEYSWVVYLFVAFILACGLTHLMSILTLWSPAYGVEGIIKLITAVLSIATAILLWPLIPKLLALPSSTQLKHLNSQLATTIQEQERTASLLRESEAQVRSSNVELERRVAERTAELVAANAQLTEALLQRTKAQAALARSEEEFRVSFEAAAVGKAQGDPETGRITRSNRAFAHMLGYEPDEILGRAWWEFTHPDDLASEKIEFARVVSGELDTYTSEKRYIRKDGTFVWGRVSATVVRHPGSNQPDIAIAVIEDIDARHKAQAALEVAKRDLEAMVKERTTALHQRDLLLREVYHRVKNNLQIIDSLITMQARQLSDPDAKAALQSLRNRVYALGLVHHQLMGSQNLQTFDVAPFLQELSSNIIEGSARDDIALSVKAIPLDVGLDFAIPLGLLVTELVTNSLKHAFPDGKGHIDVVLNRAQDGTVALVVSDDGRGYETPDTASSEQKGLGARIISGVVAQLRATMTVNNSNGTRSEINIGAAALA